MRIENSIIQFHPQCHFETLRLTDLQRQYLADLQSQQTISQIALRYLELGWLMNFDEMYRLIESLSLHSWILNPEFKEYFQQKHLTQKMTALASDANVLSDQIDLKKYPFFRSLSDELIEYFVTESELFEMRADSVLCQIGDHDRHLYVLVSGEACLYKNNSEGRMQYIAHLKAGSVFGEMSFFLGTPRTAQIVTTKQSKILKINYNKAVLDPHMNQEKNKAIVYRFWIQQALNNSDFFKNIPSDCLDQLTFAGQIVRLKEGYRLFNQGDQAAEAYILIQGQLSVYQNQQKINTLMQGSMVGEVALMAAKGLRTATVQAERECLLLHIKNSDFYQLLANNLALAKEIQILAANRLQKDQQRISRL